MSERICLGFERAQKNFRGLRPFHAITWQCTKVANKICEYRLKCHFNKITQSWTLTDSGDHSLHANAPREINLIAAKPFVGLCDSDTTYLKPYSSRISGIKSPVGVLQLPPEEILPLDERPLRDRRGGRGHVAGRQNKIHQNLFRWKPATVPYAKSETLTLIKNSRNKSFGLSPEKAFSSLCS